MRKLFYVMMCTLLVAVHTANAAGNEPLFTMHPNVHNDQSMQRGARLFMNYCHSCHSAAYSRYSRVAEDLGITEEAMTENLIFTDRKYRDTMEVALPSEQGKEWFGAPPPDLSVRARARGADWIYSFLKSFYVNENASRGWDNCMLPGTSMPHVLWELQGMQELEGGECHPHNDGHSGGHGQASPFKLVSEGLMSPDEYDQAMYDLTNFLVYLSEPAKLKRQSIGIWVLLFIAIFGVISYYLKKEYWKDIH